MQQDASQEVSIVTLDTFILGHLSHAAGHTPRGQHCFIGHLYFWSSLLRPCSRTCPKGSASSHWSPLLLITFLCHSAGRTTRGQHRYIVSIVTLAQRVTFASVMHLYIGTQGHLCFGHAAGRIPRGQHRDTGTKSTAQAQCATPPLGTASAQDSVSHA
eukprot:845833-Pelagomonas_calceolata.AAC.2